MELVRTTYEDVAIIDLQLSVLKRIKSALGRQRPRPCRYFAQGFCRLGDSCAFSHTVGETHLEEYSAHVYTDGESWPCLQYGSSAVRHPLDHGLLSPPLSIQSSPTGSHTSFDSTPPIDAHSPPAAMIKRRPSQSSSRPSLKLDISEIVENSVLRKSAADVHSSAVEDSPSYITPCVRSPGHDSPEWSDATVESSEGVLTPNDSSASSISSNASECDRPCKFFWKKTCKKGDSCLFSHDPIFADKAVAVSKRRSSSKEHRRRTIKSPSADVFSVSYWGPPPVKMEGDGWRVIGGGVMLGTNGKKLANSDRELKTQREREHVPRPTDVSALSPAEPASLELRVSSPSGGEFDTVSLSSVDPASSLPRRGEGSTDIICRPKSTPPSLAPSPFPVASGLFICAEA